MELEKVTDFMIQSAVGRIVLAILAVAIISLPILEKTLKLFSGAQDRRAKRKQELLEKEIESEKFRKNIQDFVNQVPILSTQISEMGKQMEEFNNRESTFEESQKKLLKKIGDVEEGIKDLREDSDRKDSELQAKLDTNVNQVSSLEGSLDKLSSNMDLIIESDLDEFRTYIMSAYNRYVLGQEPIDRQTMQIIKTKFRRYKKEGGNGWAESLMTELEQVPTAGNIKDGLS